ncbi:hypothetical protein BU23DRAFT_555137 [Bimuria novae-zelandiae CBS 107.79]|uniref:Protein kinase domain-containing protein n=1 Tax=Bimuria novae-zelandiae CBS 107.79 TaxID=1447943 RepID=A0A6A5V535_9PLEO|nr:hypothetical protein BU23DRAFT_555137 [Bimuria novae-zelandiae CBS 107.79]
MKICAAQIDGGTHTVHVLNDVLNFYGLQTPQGARTLPVEFLWEVLEGTLRALCFLHFGVQDMMLDEPNPNWEPVIHEDVHSENVFLDTGVSNYPRIRLGDFGISRARAEIREEWEMLPGEDFPEGYDSLDEWEATFTSEAEDLAGMMYQLCHQHPVGDEWENGEKLGGETWREGLSEDLRRVLQPLNELKKDLDPRLLEYTRHVVNTKAELILAGKLTFEVL